MNISEWLSAPIPSYSIGLLFLKENKASNQLIGLCEKFKDKPIANKLMHDFLSKIKTGKTNTPISDFRKLRDLKNEHFKLANFKFNNQLNESVSDEERKEAALFIVDTFQNVIEPIWKDLDHLESTGKLPDENYLEKQKPKVLNIQEKIKRRNNLRTYLSKYQNSLNHKAKIIKWQKELEELNAVIDAD